jgi:gliding motility-associated-like protein
MKRTFTFLSSLAIFCVLLPINVQSQSLKPKDKDIDTGGSKALILKINNKLQGEITPEVICAGDDAVYVGQVTSIPPGAWTYPSPRWTGSGAAFIDNVDANSIIFNCNVPGDYVITFSATQGVTTYTITQPLSVKAKDNLTLVLPNVNPLNVCEGSSVNFQASDASQYYWLRDDGTDTYPIVVGVGASIVESPPSVGTWKYRLYGESAGGCPTDPAFYDFEVIVEQAATANAGGPYFTCSGVGVALNGAFGGSASSAEWIGGLGTFNPNRNALNATYTPHASEAGTNVALILRTDDPAGVCGYAESNATVTVYNLPSGSITSQTNVSCFGGNNGEVTVTGSGDGAPFEYSLNGGAYQASGTFSNLTANTYTVTVRNSNFCTFNVPVTITQPASSVSGSITSQTNVLCFGESTGSVTVLGSGGTPGYTYSINGGAFQASGTFSGLSAGGHTVTVRDALLCTFNVPVTITQPATAVGGSITSQTNVLCFGASTGSVTVTGNNGTPAYEYSLDGGPLQALGTFSDLASGGYTVTVRDANLCTVNVPITITQPLSAVGGSISGQTNVSCFGGNNGAVSVDGSGGTPGYQYSFEGGAFQASGTFSGLSAGNYTVTVRDNNLCTFNVPVSITEPASAVGGSITAQTNVSCFGGNNGSVTVDGSGGTPGYMYSLDGGPFQASGLFENLTAGGYTVTVRDANLCTFNVPVTITQPAVSVTGSITSQTNVACFGGNTGAVTVTGSGGTSPYQYSINGGAYQASGTFSGLAAGPHTVTVRDALLCTFNVPVTITQPASAVSGSVASITHVLCRGASTGSVTLSGSGGTPPYTYRFGASAYQASPTFNGLAAGTYTARVRDANLCVTTFPVTITQPATAVGGSITSQTNVSCFGGNDGAVTVTGNGGTPGYQYSFNGGAYQASGTFINLSAGNHTVTVRDANLCTFVVPVTITQPAASLGGSVTSQINVSCFGGNDGEVTILGSGGTPAYQYSLDGGPFQASGLFTNLSANNYTVTIRDANSCTFNVPFTISQPATGVSGSILSQTNVLCFGTSTGSVTVTASGGTPGYEFSLDGGLFQPSGTFSGLAAGNYLVTIRDVNLCTFNVPVNITEPNVISIASIIVSNVDMCYGDTNGSIQVLASGGTPNYTYNLYDGLSLIATLTPVHPAPAIFSGLGAGTNYRVVATDINSCTPAEQSGIVITQPDELIITSIDLTEISCNGYNDGTITINVAGGTPAYEYSIDGPTPFGTFQASNVFTVGEGGYDVYVRDSKGCETAWPVQIVLTNPPAISFSYNIDQITSCYGAAEGRISISNVSGGSGGGYQFSIYDPPVWGNITIFENLPGGPTNPYYIRVIDSNGCIETANNGNPVYINQPSPITFDVINIVNVTGCWYNTNGSFRVQNVLGGTGVKQVSIDDGATWLSVPRNFTNLGVAVYTVRVRDANNCEVSQIINITGPPAIVIDNIVTSDVTCFGGSNGSITVTASGGTGLLQYSINGGAYQATGDFSGLTAGNHTIRVRDGNNCVLLQDVTLTEPAALLFTNQTPTDITCNGLTDGTITLEVSGGTAPYGFSITGTPPFTNVTGIFTGLAAGNYPVVVRDANGCVTFGSTLVISEPPVISITSQVSQDIPCFGETGSITVLASGGTGTLTYSLINNLSVVIASNTTGQFTNLLQGTYTVEVDDINGCGPITAGPFTINEPAELIISSSSFTQITCHNSDNGTITINTSGGTTPIQFTLFESGNPLFSQFDNGLFINLPAGSYTVDITDANSCGPVSAGPFVIINPATLLLNTNVINLSCSDSGNDGTISASGTGGTAPYHIILSLGGIQVADFTGVAEGATVNFTGLGGANNYEVEIRDANFPVCPAVTSGLLTLIVPDPLTIGLPVVQNPSCIGQSDGTVDIQAAGGTLSYTYTLFNSSDVQIGAPIVSANTNPVQFTGLIAGAYYITVDDANGCGPVISNTFSISDPAPIVFNAIKTDMDCYGGPGNGTGQVFFNVISGGTAPFEYSVDGGFSFTPVNPVTGLSGGDYTVIVRDANGCLSTTQTVNIFEPDELTLSLTGFNVSCSGGSNGRIIATAAGGTVSGSSPYLYQLDGAGPWQTSNVFNGVSAGLHTITVVDAKNCTTTESITIDSPAPISILTVNSVDPTCTDLGTITVTATGGTGALVFTLQPGGATSATGVFNNLGGGTFTVEVSDANGCGPEVTAPITLTSPSLISLDNIIITAATGCYGTTSNGSIEIIASGGTGALTYSIDGGATTFPTNIFNGLSPGDYIVVVNDVANCPQAMPVTVGGPAEITYNILVEMPENPSGAANGVILVEAFGGTGLLTFNLFENTLGLIASNTNGLFENLANGTYWVVITDANSCSVTTRLIVLAGLNITVTSTDVSCFGADDGTITITVDGGTPPYTITWSGPSGPMPAHNNSLSIGSLQPGIYTVYIIDFDGVDATINIEIFEPAVLDILPPEVVSPLCHPSQGGSNTGSITVVAKGGTPPYIYSLEDSNGVPMPETSSGFFDNLLTGNYTLLVTDANSCTFTNVITVVEPTPITYDQPIFVQHPSSHTASDGQIVVVAHGGTGSYSYTLLPNNISNGSGIFSNLPSGVYQVVITDGNNCSVTTTNIQLTGFTVTLTPNHISCSGANDGWINVSLVGVVPPVVITLFWVEGDQYIIGGLSESEKILEPGTYLVTVTSGGNIITVQTEINEPSQITASVTLVSNPSCYGVDNGFVIFDINGGTPFADGYDISWDGGSSRGLVAQPLGAGTFTFTITDANGCSITLPDQVVITAPESMTLESLTVFDLSCFENNTGYIEMLVSGGAEPITYTIDGPNGPISNNDGVFSGLPAGTYFIEIQDLNGCLYQFTTGGSVVLNEPSAISISSVLTTFPELQCHYSTIPEVEMNVSGGTPDYTFSWSNGQVTQNLFLPTPGTYTIEVTDSQGCIASEAIVIPGPEPMLYDVTYDVANCRVAPFGDVGGIHITNVTGGNGTFGLPSGGDFQISWPMLGSEFDNKWSLTDLQSGSYTAVITDQKGCIDNAVFGVPYTSVNAFVPDIFKEDDYYCYDATANLNLVLLLGSIGSSPTIEWYHINGPNPNVSVHNGITYTIPNLQESLIVHRVDVYSTIGCLEQAMDTIRVYPPIRPWINPDTHPFITPDNVFGDPSVISVLADVEYNIEVSVQSAGLYGYLWVPNMFFYLPIQYNPTMKFQTGFYEPYQTGTINNPNTGRPEKYIPIKAYVTDIYGCVDSLEMKARILNGVKVPNVFTPNGDGINDRWMVPYAGLFPDLEVKIFNRWGYTIWEAKGSEAVKGWDGNNSRGNPYPTGTYYYVINFNVAGSSGWKPISGSVTIVR